MSPNRLLPNCRSCPPDFQLPIDCFGARAKLPGSPFHHSTACRNLPPSSAVLYPSYVVCIKRTISFSFSAAFSLSNRSVKLEQRSRGNLAIGFHVLDGLGYSPPDSLKGGFRALGKPAEAGELDAQPDKFTVNFRPGDSKRVAVSYLAHGQGGDDGIPIHDITIDTIINGFSGVGYGIRRFKARFVLEFRAWEFRGQQA